MTEYLRYLKTVNELLDQHDSWRAGQASFNVLSDFHKSLADQVRGTELDPFYDDSRLPVFYQWVYEAMGGL